MNWLEITKDQTGLDFVKKGTKVIACGEHGEIIGSNAAGNWKVRHVDKSTDFYSPTWGIKYLSDDGEIIKEFPE